MKDERLSCGGSTILLPLNGLVPERLRYEVLSLIP